MRLADARPVAARLDAGPRPLTPSPALAVATIGRPQVVQRLIVSARRRFPTMPIYVADQSRQVDAMMPFYQQYGVRVFPMPFDCGVTVSRNRLVQAIDDEFFILCDDDFILTEETDFTDALTILRTCPEIAVIGGRLRDFDGSETWVRSWEMFLEHDRKNRILFSIPMAQLAPQLRRIGRITYYLCDAVLNFALFRRAAFASGGLGWDERFKSNGEHEDFYLTLKSQTSFQVAHLPTLVADHHHPEDFRGYRVALRDRSEGWRRFFDKWNLDQHVEIGLGVRTRDDFSAVFNGEVAKARFFINPDLSLRQTAANPDLMLTDTKGVLMPVGRLNAEGDATIANGAADPARLLLDRSSGTLLVAQPPRPGPSALNQQRIRPAARYRLQASAAENAVSTLHASVYFRYAPLLRPGADFLLWSWCDEIPPVARDRRCIAVAARWTTSDGRILLWKGPRTYLDLAALACWQPILLALPATPVGTRWLRFDLVTDGGPSADPVMTGFLFATGDDDADVLGLSRLPMDGATATANGHNLTALARSTRPRPAPFRVNTGGVLAFNRSAMPDIEALFFVGWSCFDRALVSARLPRAALSDPAQLAIPSDEAAKDQRLLYGYGATCGFVLLVPSDDRAQNLDA